MSNLDHSQDAKDRYFMMLAIEQAKLGLYTARPNPAVGCVIVQAEEVVGQGFHPKAGQPHAEVFALKDAGIRTVGATAYVTLEPCTMCIGALIHARVNKLVYAASEPRAGMVGSQMDLSLQSF